MGDSDPLVLVRSKPPSTLPERGLPIGNLASACGVCNRTRSDRPLLAHLAMLQRGLQAEVQNQRESEEDRRERDVLRWHLSEVIKRPGDRP